MTTQKRNVIISLTRRCFPPHIVTGIAGMLTFFAIWQLLWALAVFPAMFLPSPAEVVAKAFSLLSTGNLLHDLTVSILRVCGGFFIAFCLAHPFGVIMGVSLGSQRLLSPIFSFIRYMPATAFVPLLVLWLGIGEGQKLAVVFMGAYFHLTLMIAQSVRSVPDEFKESAKILGAKGWKLLFNVILPAAQPLIWNNLRITLGWAWTYIVVAEMVAAQSGVGFAILRASRYMDISTMFVGVISIGLVGIVSDWLFVLAGKYFFPYLNTARD